MIRYTAEGPVYEEREFHSGQFEDRVFFYWLEQWMYEWLWQQQTAMLRERMAEPDVVYQ